jgi:histone acetyltransferase (RNA polymerase elongator complex component)
MTTITDIEQTNSSPYWFDSISKDNIIKCYKFLDRYYNKDIDKKTIKNEFIKYQGEEKFEGIKFGYLVYIYQLARQNGKYNNPDIELEKQLKTMVVRENSGVSVYSIFTSGFPSYTKDNIEHKEMFSCKYDCHYCPNIPDGKTPRSYIKSEPGVARAWENDFDPQRQIIARAKQYIQQGNSIDKAEIIIQGGTWDSYPTEYRIEFVRDIYYTFNILMNYLFNQQIRNKYTLEEEIKQNETSSCRVIGLTPETRPDQINFASIRFLRQIGATRVQLGVQHLDDTILRYINRKCYTKHTIRAIKMLKDSGFKVDAHIMPDLPAPPGYEDKMAEVDKEMLEELNTNPDLKVDQLKLYPCMVIEHTKIKEWYDKGIYKPYGEDKMMTMQDKIAWRKLSKEDKLRIRYQNPLYKNILDFYKKVHPSIRINRIIRDIPISIVCGGTKRASMRSELEQDLDTMDELSTCIRYREVGNHRNKNRIITTKPIMKELCFEASGGKEYFLSYESSGDNPILYGFCRLRLSNNSGKSNSHQIIFPELLFTALIRELHVYGKVIACNDNQKYYENNNIFIHQDNSNKTQHKGFGKKLLARAEEIAFNNGYKRIAVIAGVGVRDYYAKNGYTINSNVGCYQIKILKKNKHYIIFKLSLLFIILAIICYNLLNHL